MINCIVVCGPTASGKTRLSVELAEKFSGEIISADSRQVYRGMDIGTGKDLHEYNTLSGIIPVHLIDIVDPVEIYTIYNFKYDFYNVFDAILTRNHIPFLTGGSGLYIESILRGFNIPAIPENVSFRKKNMLRDKKSLIDELKSISEDIFNRTDLSSKKRVVRALEVATFTSKKSEYTNSKNNIEPLVLCTRWERSELHSRIDRRLHDRLKNGMIDEVKLLIESGVPKIRLIQFGMEYKNIVQYLDNNLSYNEMVQTLTRDIHRLAKRQETWFRGMERRGIPIHWIDNSNTLQAHHLLNQHLNQNTQNE